MKQNIIFITVIFLLSACTAHKQQIMLLDVKNYEELIEAIHFEKYDSSEVIQIVEISIDCYSESEALKFYSDEFFFGYTAKFLHPSSDIWVIEYVKEIQFDANQIKADSDKFIPVLVRYPNCDGPFSGVAVKPKNQ